MLIMQHRQSGKVMKNLYLASNLEELKSKLKGSDLSKWNTAMLCNSAQKILDQAKLAIAEHDEEKAFIYLFRYSDVVLTLQKRSVPSKLAGEITKLIEQVTFAIEEAEKIEKSLRNRYDVLSKCEKKKLEENEKPLVPPQLEPKVEKTSEKEIDHVTEKSKHLPSLPDEHSSSNISCHNLNTLLHDPESRIMLLDARPKREYEESHIQHNACINFPEESLKPCFTGAELLSKLSNITSEDLEISKIDYVLLMDYCSEDEEGMLFNHPLRILKSAVKECTKAQIKLVKGGYKEWLLSYPFESFSRSSRPLKPASEDSNRHVIDSSEKRSNPYPDLNFALTETCLPSHQVEKSRHPVHDLVPADRINDQNPTFITPPVNRQTKPKMHLSASKPPIGALDESIIQLPDLVLPYKASDSDPKTVSVSSRITLPPNVNRNLKPAWEEIPSFKENSDRQLKRISSLKLVEKEIQGVGFEQELMGREKQLKILESMMKDMEKDEMEELVLRKKMILDEINLLKEKCLENTVERLAITEEIVRKEKMPDIDDRSGLEEFEKNKKQKALQNQETMRKSMSTTHEKDLDSVDHFRSESAKVRQKYAKEKEYEDSHRNFGHADRDSKYSSGLTRSYSSPNIAHMLAEQIPELTKKQPTVDRSLKPKLGDTLNMRTEVSSVRIRNLSPTYGNALVRGVTGLRNLGNSCYMNSVIQCLSNTKQITTYFQSDVYRQHLRRSTKQGTNGELAEEFAFIIKSLWTGQYKNFYPRDFKNVASKYIPLCRGQEQQDSHEFLVVLMDKLHGDLNQGHSAMMSHIVGLAEIEARKFWNDQHSENWSKISETFEGLQKSTLSCCSCGKKSNSFEIFSCVSLPISPTRCSLLDCLNTFMKTEKIAAWACPSCKQKKEAEKLLSFCKIPDVLIIQLKRFSYDGRWRSKINVLVDFPFELSLDYGAGCRYESKQYSLYAVINHSGNLEGGHYTAYCKNSTNGTWYLYDDSEVSEIYISQIRSPAAYLLFYAAEKCKS